MASSGHSDGIIPSLTNYVAFKYLNAVGKSRIGSLDLERSVIQPLAFASGAPLSNLYQVIEIGESQIEAAGEIISLSEVELLAPIYGRDILAVGKNYAEHAKGIAIRPFVERLMLICFQNSTHLGMIPLTRLTSPHIP